MSDAAATDTADQLRRALSALKEMRLRLEAAEAAASKAREPIAIIGMGCRLPGASNPDELWELVRDGRDAIVETPADRWDHRTIFDEAPDAPGKVATRWGGFLDGIDRFDASFFAISPREAEQMDPQQRLMLEVAWEALEDGGQAVDRLAGTSTGVFIGVHSHSNDYYAVQSTDPTGLDLYSGTGTSHSVISGRLSYLLDLRGPSLAIDTACSSSLVAIHLAVGSLRSGESSLAIAGGVNVMIDPTFTMVASRMRMMSPSGRCRPFDAGADGFVRAEGCATVILKRLSDAIADGDRIHAVIAGSATTQDGRSNGLTAPNGLSQQAVVRAALADANLSPDSVDVIETHGTGTPLGDPIEVEALASVFGAGAAEPSPAIALGALKSNVGHTEGAAGVAALVKTVMSIRAGEVTPVVHYEQPNPHIAIDSGRFAIPTEATPWPSRGERRVAGVSSFGWSGTNAHLVVTEAPEPGANAVDKAADDLGILVLPISADGDDALNELVGAYRDLLVDASPDEAARICATAARRRSHLGHRTAVVGRDAESLIDALDARLNGDAHQGLAHGGAVSSGGSLTFVCAGQGGQWPGMAKDLIENEPVFREVIDRCADAFGPLVDWSLHDVLTGTDGAAGEAIDVVQPALFAIQVALAALWQSRGVVPDSVVGHSMGEVAAAHIAGALSLEDAALVICERSRLLRTISGNGAMAVVELDVSDVADHLVGLEDRLSIAVSNSRTSTVVSGDPDALDSLLLRWEADGVFCRRVKVDVASHSPQVEPLLGPLVEATSGIEVHPVGPSFMSTVTADYVDDGSLDPSYWSSNLRRPVRFADAVDALIADGSLRFAELGPHPTLVSAVDEALRDGERGGAAVACMRRDDDGPLGMLLALASLYVSGQPIDWTCIHPDLPPAELPAYPWQRERYWVEPSKTTGVDAVDAMIHPLTWERSDRPMSPRTDGIDAWLLVTTGDADPTPLAGRLAADGTPCRSASLADLAGSSEAMTDEIDGTEGRLGIVVLSRDHIGADEPAADVAARQIRRIAAITQLAARVDRGGRDTTMWIVTDEANVVVHTDLAAGYADATLWGLGRSLGDELPHLWGGNIDVAGDDPAAAAAAIADELGNEPVDGSVDAEVAVRDGVRFVARLARQMTPPSDPIELTGTVIVTGGFGAVGRRVARWAVEHGARHLVLASRTDLQRDDVAPGSSMASRLELVTELETAGVDVRAMTVDAGDEASLAAFLERVEASDLPPIQAVFHAAAEFGGQLVGEVDDDAVSRQFLAKAVGALAFHRLPDLEHLVLFSSLASVLPAAGQSAYAASNAFLDGLAHHRGATGLPAISINWGFWEGSDQVAAGAATEEAEAQAIKATADALERSRGINGFRSDVGLEAMHRLMRSPHHQAAVAPINWRTLAASHGAGSGHLVSSRIAEEVSDHHTVAAVPVVDQQVAVSTLLETIVEASPGERVDVAEAAIGHIVGGVLRLPGDRLDMTAPFGSLGLDSLMSIELRNALERQLGTKFSATVAWNYPSVRELTAHVLDRIVGSTDPSDSTDSTDDPAHRAATDEIVSNVSELSEDDALAALLGGDR